MKLKVVPFKPDDFFVIDDTTDPVLVGRCTDLKSILETISEATKIDIGYVEYPGNYLCGLLSKDIKKSASCA